MLENKVEASAPARPCAVPNVDFMYANTPQSKMSLVLLCGVTELKSSADPTPIACSMHCKQALCRRFPALFQSCPIGLRVGFGSEHPLSLG